MKKLRKAEDNREIKTRKNTEKGRFKPKHINNYIKYKWPKYTNQNSSQQSGLKNITIACKKLISNDSHVECKRMKQATICNITN